MKPTGNLRLAVDIGGTFTDTVLVDGSQTVLATTKTPTTPDDPTKGALAGVQHVMDVAGAAFGDVSGFVHGTTLATNALIERKGARVVSITTEGFRDILEIAYERRYSQYDINLDKPDLIIGRESCLTFPERMSATGQVIRPLAEQELDRLLAEIDTLGADAVAICFLHSYANPAHEIRLRDLIAERRPELVVSISSDVSPEAREFDRLCTTLANAYVQPLMAGYLASFQKEFSDRGITCPILMMTASGGMTTITTAAKYPIRLVESGPAGGAILAAQVARELDLSDVLSFDMGGTTAKLCLIDKFSPQTARNFEISRASRFVKGSGMPVRIPVLEMIEIGAGGGSIANVDSLGRLRVGPESAGSEPGPVAFGKGGAQPTVTDSDVVLGLIPAGPFAEGRLEINAAAATEVVAETLGNTLELDAVQAAFGVSEIVDEGMASAGRMHAVESGKDLGQRSMIAFGGNGPLHATRVARRAGVSHIVVPQDPGVGSAVGFLSAPVSFELVRSFYAELDALDVVALNRFFDELTQEAESVVRAAAPDAELVYRKSAFMRYHGQGHEIEVVLPEGAFQKTDVEGLQDRFEIEYSKQFSRAVPGMRVEILNWALAVSTPAERPLIDLVKPESRRVSPERKRGIVCDVTGQSCEAGVIARTRLKPGDQLSGPVLIEEAQTTTFVSSDFAASVDGAGNLHLQRTNPERMD